MKRKFILIISVIIILIISVCVLLLNKSKEVAKNSDEIYINVENELMAENTNNVYYYKGYKYRGTLYYGV